MRAVAVFIAAMMDGIDGRVARLTGTSSEFGVQYDSLADLVSFGMAPALVMYHWSLSCDEVRRRDDGQDRWAVAFLYAACAALRLARFNSQVGTVDKRWFIGLASPAAAGLMMSFVWTFADGDLGWSGEQLRYVALGVTMVAAPADGQPDPLLEFQGHGEGGAEGRPCSVLRTVPGPGRDRGAGDGSAARAAGYRRDLCVVRPGFWLWRRWRKVPEAAP